jgi:LacI family transcriptional regulator
MRQAARDQGASIRQIVLPHRTPAGAGADITHQWLAARLRAEEPSFAVLAAHDLLAMTVLDAREAADLRTPEQVAVLGVDNDEIICGCARVPLSSVDNDLFRHSYEAAQLLGRLLDGEVAPAQPILIPPRRVVVRGSTDAIAARDPRLTSILQHLHEHLDDPTLSVKTLCLRSGLSRRKLETLFDQASLKSPGQVIHEVRLRRACAQLAAGDQTVQQIAAACGFASAGSFGRYFHQVKEVSPEAWRRVAKR